MSDAPTPALMLALLLALPAAQAQTRSVWRCPGNLYTDQIEPAEAQARGCKAIEGAALTVIQSSPPRRTEGEGSRAPAAAASGARVDPAEQRARDSDKRRILEAELAREEERLGALLREYRGGQPQRREDERDPKAYQDRVAALKASIERSQADVAALKRELAKTAGQPG